MTKKTGTILKELLLLLGVAFVWVGLYMIYQPISFIIIGAGIVWFAYPKKVNE